MTALRMMWFLLKVLTLGLVLTLTWMTEGIIFVLLGAGALALVMLVLLGMVLDPHREERDPYAVDIQRRNEALGKGQHTTPP